MRTTHLPRVLDSNLLTAPISTVTLADGSTATFHNWAASACTVTPANCFVNPAVLQNNVFTSDGRADYKAFTLDLTKRFSRNASLMASYTWSKATDNVSDYTVDFAPFDQANLAAETAPSDFDQRHKIVMAGVFEWPKVFIVSPIFRYNSGHPFTLLTGVDVNGDRH